MPMILWSKLKTYLRMNPCGAACACAAPAANSWVAMLLLLRLPCGQPSVEFVLAHNLKHAVHFVMTKPAQFRARYLIVASLCGREMHTNRQARDRVLLEAHGRYEEAVDHILRAQDDFHFVVYWHEHGAGHDIIFGRGVGRIQT